jgi:hypothetical protein
MQIQTRLGSPVEARHHRYPERGWAQLDPDAIAPGIPRTRPPTSSSMVANRAADHAFRRRPPQSARPRALIAILINLFARITLALKMRVEDLAARTWLDGAVA